MRRLTALVLVVLATAVVGVYVVANSDGDDVVRLDRSGPDADQAAGPRTPITGRPLPDLTVNDSDGNEIRLGTLVGRPLVINVWYSTCAPCKRELPAFAAVHDELGERVRFIGINPVDRDGGDDFARELGVRYELLRDPDGLLLSAAGINGFPTTLLVDADGTIVGQHTGAMTADSLRAAISRELLE